MKNKHLSISQIKMYLRCPLSWKFRYIDGLIIAPTGSLTLGKSVHSALEGNYTQKIKSRQDLPIAQVTDLFADSWEAQVKDTIFGDDEKAGEFKDDGVGLIAAYQKEVAPTIQPQMVEKEFNLEFENVGYTLKGFIDLIDINGIIVDHKTTKRCMNADDVAVDLQLSGYALAYRSVFGAEEKGLRFDVMVRNKTPKIQQIPTTRTQADIDRFLKVTGYVAKAIEQGIFYPSPNFMCSMCGYKDLCRKW